MNDRFRVARSLAGRLRAHGVPLAAVLQRAGLPATFFQQDRILATTAELFALWRSIGETSSDRAIGLKLGAEQRTEHYSPTAIAAVCSRNLRDALQRIGRYKRLTCPEEIRLRASRSEVSVEAVYVEAEEREPEVMVDLVLSWLLSVGRRGTDGRIVPLRVELARKAGDRALLEGHFGCRVHFAARRNALVFAASDLETPFVTHNEDLLAAVGAQLDIELGAVHVDYDLADQVKRALKRSMAGKQPVLQSIAVELGLSERTLQRRLGEIGRSFQQLAEEARRELARHYLGRSQAEFHEIAFLLGYEDANSFFRAFHQWEGMTPGAWRARHEEPLAVAT